MLKLQQVEATKQWWERVHQSPDHTIFHTPEWIQFIAETQNATPVFAEIRDGSAIVGYFFSLVFSYLGIRILGSPFPRWTTMYMGFNLQPDVPRWLALQAVEPFAYNDLGCLHFEVADRLFTTEDGERIGMQKRFFGSYETDLTKSEAEIFHSMESTCRTCVRKATRCGVTIDESKGDEVFASDFYTQLQEVFIKQGLVPTYPRETVSKLIKHIYPTGRLLLLRARDPDGNCIATGIYPGMNRFAQFWGNASLRSGQHFRPNQAMNWYALKYWKSRGAECFDWGGEGAYKEKYGCKKVIVHRFSKSRLTVLPMLRNLAERTLYGAMRVKGQIALRHADRN